MTEKTHHKSKAICFLRSQKSNRVRFYWTSKKWGNMSPNDERTRPVSAGNRWSEEIRCKSIAIDPLEYIRFISA